eukprot:gene4109-4798_t
MSTNQYQQYYWGIPDSPLDWCELNYNISPYICEYYNTLSSGIISLIAFYGLFILLATRQNAAMKQVGIRNWMVLAYLTLATIGLGSAFYHATLLYKNQLFDEAPMLIFISIGLYCLLSVDPVKKSDSALYKAFRFLLPFALVLYFTAVGITIFMIRTMPTILQVSFGFLTVSLYVQSLREVLKSRTPLACSNPKKLLLASALSILTAYSGWLIERKFCDGGNVIPYIQLHALWHVLCGFAGFYWIQFFVALTSEKHSYETTINFSQLGACQPSKIQ